MVSKRVLGGLLGIVLLAAIASSIRPVRADTASKRAVEILAATGVKGGVVVHVGCGDGELTAALHVGDQYVVQGLDRDADDVERARRHIKSAGLYGEVSAAHWTGDHLPYVDGLVNLLVVEDPQGLPKKEMMRVLVPHGVAYVKQGTGWSKTVKKWPSDIDQWTHYMHDPAGSCVSRDDQVGPPKGLRWTGGPKWARSHEHSASMQAMVSSEGRVFHVMDEGRTESIQLPPKYMLTARDAFNGTVLWKREVPHWFNHLYPLKSGPAYMPRRLVAVNDTVYVAPGHGQNVMALDGASGDVRHEYENTATTVELICSNGVVFAVVEPEREMVDYKQEHPNCWRERDRASKTWAWSSETRQRLMAIDADTGKVNWVMKSPIATMTLAVDNEKACFFDGKQVVAVDRESGELLWESKTLTEMGSLSTGYGGPKLLLHGEYVLLSPKGQIYALKADSGELVWSTSGKPRSGHFSPEDLFVIRGIVWAAGTARGRDSEFVGYDLETGEQAKVYPNQVEVFYMHQRCYPGRATEKYLIPSATGTEFVDLDSGQWQINHWVRGGCIYGMMPANGLLYATPHACACYYESKVDGFNGLTTTDHSESPVGELNGPRLKKGPAYGDVDAATADATTCWPAFRHDNERSGALKTGVATEVSQAWKMELGKEVSQPTAAYGKLFVSAVDAHTVHALDQETGREVWEFTADGRVDSPPTLHKGMAIFGSKDGWVYAVRASDGVLCWKFRAEPRDLQIMSYNQLESAWPLSGSVLIQDGKLYTVAGRSMFLDGGLRMIILDPETGKLIAENVMDEKVPGTNDNLQRLMKGKHMPMAQPDILSSDGKYVYMKSLTFTKDGKRVRIEPLRPDEQYGEEVHLFSPISFLDDSWQHRTYWLYGRAAGQGWGEFQLPPKRVPYGRIMCIDDGKAYAYARDPELMCNCSINEYRLYCADKEPVRRKGFARSSVNWKQLAQLPREKLTGLKYHWEDPTPEIMVKAMVLAGDNLFMAGPPDVVDEKEMWGKSHTDEYQRKMKEQNDALQGKQGSRLWAVSRKTGEKLAEVDLDVLPAFNGLIAADGKLFMTTEEGEVVCFKGK